MFEVLGKSIRYAERAFLVLACIALFGLTLLTTADALLRYIFNAPITGSHELADEFLMPTVIYFALTYVYSSGGHIRITIVSDLLPLGMQRALLCLWDTVAAALFATVAHGVWHRMWESYEFREYSTSPLDYLLAPSYAIVAIGATLMAIRLALAAITARHPKPGTLSLDH